MIEGGQAEEMVLLTIRRLGDETFGVSARRQIRKDTIALQKRMWKDVSEFSPDGP